VIGVITFDVELAANNRKVSEKRGEGEGLFFGDIVEFGGQVRLGLAHAVEKPGMESDGILGKKGSGILRNEVKVEADEFAG
jgi:hypothetical protein